MTKYFVTQWQIQAGNIKTNNKVKVNLCLPEFSANKTVTQEFIIDEFSESNYGMVLGRDWFQVSQNKRVPVNSKQSMKNNSFCGAHFSINFS